MPNELHLTPIDPWEIAAGIALDEGLLPGYEQGEGPDMEAFRRFYHKLDVSVIDDARRKAVSDCIDMMEMEARAADKPTKAEWLVMGVCIACVAALAAYTVWVMALI